MNPIYYQLLTEPIEAMGLAQQNAIGLIKNLICFDVTNISEDFCHQYTKPADEKGRWVCDTAKLPRCIPPFDKTLYIVNENKALICIKNGNSFVFFPIETGLHSSVLFPITTVVNFNKEGIIEDFTHYQSKDIDTSRFSVPIDTLWDYFRWYMIRSLLGNALSHCRNIKIEERELPAGRFRKRLKRANIPRIKYKTIQIVTSQGSSSRRKGEHSQREVSQHIRRGNFATYKHPNLYMGKYECTVYRPMCLVGKREKGRIVKEYEV